MYKTMVPNKNETIKLNGESQVLNPKELNMYMYHITTTWAIQCVALWYLKGRTHNIYADMFPIND